MTTGFFLGKFLPPHHGHVFLANFAQEYADRITILVCSLPQDPIPGNVRAQWMRELAPGARIVHLDDPTVPQVPEEHPDFWSIWQEVVRQAHPEPIDYVFASERYGHRLAHDLQASFVPVDIARVVAPISGAEILDDPYGHWEYIPAPVRPWFVRRVVLFGPESTGKTTLARELAVALDTVWVPEYGRQFTEEFGTEVDGAGLVAIARGHSAASRAARRQANRLLIEDTDPLLTAVWSLMLNNRRIIELDTFSDPADLYLLTSIDLPWTDDGTRYFPADDQRAHFFDLCISELERRALNFVVIGGIRKERLAAALEAIHTHLPEVFPPRADVGTRR